jgi:phage repressor protein C with HTH and peptisase S24 domain
MARLAEAKGASLDWLASGNGSPTWAGADAALDAYVLIPIWDGEASSGHGSYAISDDVRGTLAFSSAWIGSIIRGSVDTLSVVFNRGDSNAPDINDGDAMLVDRGIERIEDDAYYLFDEGGVLLVKMIERQLGGVIALKSRNPDYATRTLTRAQAADVTVFGRVRWRGGAV